MKHDVAVEAAKAVPPVSASIVASAQGWSMNDWMALATIIYVAMQAGYLAWKWRKEYKAK